MCTSEGFPLRPWHGRPPGGSAFPRVLVSSHPVDKRSSGRPKRRLTWKERENFEKLFAGEDETFFFFKIFVHLPSTRTKLCEETKMVSSFWQGTPSLSLDHNLRSHRPRHSKCQHLLAFLNSHRRLRLKREEEGEEKKNILCV